MSSVTSAKKTRREKRRKRSEEHRKRKIEAEAYDESSEPTQKKQIEYETISVSNLKAISETDDVNNLRQRLQTAEEVGARLLKRCELLEKQIRDLKYENRQLRKSRIEVTPSPGISIIHLFDKLGKGAPIMKNFCRLLSIKDVLNLSATCKYFYKRITPRHGSQPSVLSSLVTDTISEHLDELQQNGLLFGDLLNNIGKWKDSDQLKSLIMQNPIFSFTNNPSSARQIIIIRTTQTSNPSLIRFLDRLTPSSKETIPMSTISKDSKIEVIDETHKFSIKPNKNSPEILKDFKKEFVNKVQKELSKAPVQIERNELFLNPRNKKRQKFETNKKLNKEKLQSIISTAIPQTEQVNQALPVEIAITDDITVRNLERCYDPTWFSKAYEYYKSSDEAIKFDIISYTVSLSPERDYDEIAINSVPVEPGPSPKLKDSGNLEAITINGKLHKRVKEIICYFNSIEKIISSLRGTVIGSVVNYLPDISTIHSFRLTCKSANILLLTSDIYLRRLWEVMEKKNFVYDRIFDMKKVLGNIQSFTFGQLELARAEKEIFNSNPTFYTILECSRERLYDYFAASSYSHFYNDLFLFLKLNTIIEKKNPTANELKKSSDIQSLPKFIKTFYDKKGKKNEKKVKILKFKQIKQKANVEGVESRTKIIEEIVKKRFGIEISPRQRLEKTLITGVIFADIQNIAWKWVPAVVRDFDMKTTLVIAFSSYADKRIDIKPPSWIIQEYARTFIDRSDENCGKSGDQAVDVCLCLRALWFHLSLPLSVPFYIISQDRGFVELQCSLLPRTTSMLLPTFK